MDAVFVPNYIECTKGLPREAVIPGEKKPQTVAWAVERKDGGRGFGFTGGHFFANWYVPEFRKMVLNAIVWTAKAPKVSSAAPGGA